MKETVVVKLTARDLYMIAYGQARLLRIDTLDRRVLILLDGEPLPEAEYDATVAARREGS